MRPRLKILGDHDALARAAAERAADALRRAVAQRGRALLVLSGGRTPLAAYRLLAGMDLPWEATHLFWGDERMVPYDHPESNFGAARATGLPARVPPENLHPMPAAMGGPSPSARAYQDELRRTLSGPNPAFDLVLLGMGPDGHTASLFPGDPALTERQRWVAPVDAPRRARPRLPRVTLTLPALSSGRQVIFMAGGEGKRRALAAVLAGEPLPAAMVRPGEPPLWLVDAELGEGL